ncbi:MAG: CBS domain-containing protein [Ignavibacteria bacterium]|nr:CBS domain-containing protein [Ignavibacteria bacterium]
MGIHPLNLYSDPEHLNRFTFELINDIKALEQMLGSGMIEGGIRRIGAEQELCLLDSSWRPAPVSLQVLERIEDPHYTTEHSLYNLEINLDPLEFSGHCLSEMESNIRSSIARLDQLLESSGYHSVLVGILPTVRRSDLNLSNLTPLPRYQTLNDILNTLKGGPYEFRIDGIDELMTRHNSIMFEGCNTSFQVHLQLDPASSVSQYNWAQAIAGPVLAAATNSPMLLGKRLWHETRIALFQQSVDTRRSSNDLRERKSRVTFGDRWICESIAEVFKEDMAHYRVLMGIEVEENSVEALRQGNAPRLTALQMHNSTVYRWNRPCYGIKNGKPHLRIECRYLPSGPTVIDQMANAAFWLGLMTAYPDPTIPISSLFRFDDAKRNFLAAARGGLETQVRWLGGRILPVDQLILEELIPQARAGLEHAEIDSGDARMYLGIIEERVRTRLTGSHWMLKSYVRLHNEGMANYEACVALTAGIVQRQESGTPVHQWKLVNNAEAGDWMNRFWKVEHIMVSNLFTVRETDLIYFAANVMTWKHIRYAPVEDEKGRLVGLLTSRALLAYHSNGQSHNDATATVGEIMVKNPKTVSPDTPSVDALLLMRKLKIGCLPVTAKGKLIGILTESDFMNLSEISVEKLVEESARFARQRQAASGNPI